VCIYHGQYDKNYTLDYFYCKRRKRLVTLEVKGLKEMVNRLKRRFAAQCDYLILPIIYGGVHFSRHYRDAAGLHDFAGQCCERHTAPFYRVVSGFSLVFLVFLSFSPLRLVRPSVDCLKNDSILDRSRASRLHR